MKPYKNYNDSLEKEFYIATETARSIRLEGPLTAKEVDKRYFEIKQIEGLHSVRVHAFNKGEASFKVVCHLLNRERFNEVFPGFSLGSGPEK